MLLSLLLFGCSAQKSNRILTFFFDGVPEDMHDQDTVMTEEGSDSLLTSTMIAAVPTVHYHYPYLEKECSSCHLESSMGEYTDAQPALCYQCHMEYPYEYEYIHGPVSGGYCTACHAPHQSENEKLLMRTGRDLCTWCHDNSTLFNEEIHSGLEDTNCTECHSPHGGEDSSLLR